MLRAHRARAWWIYHARGHASPIGRRQSNDGWRVSSTTVGRLLHELGYSLQSVRKSREGAPHPDRNEQFEHISATAATFLRREQPVISVDTKKKELVDFKNGGRRAPTRAGPAVRAPGV